MRRCVTVTQGVQSSAELERQLARTEAELEEASAALRRAERDMKLAQAAALEHAFWARLEQRLLAVLRAEHQLATGLDHLGRARPPSTPQSDC